MQYKLILAMFILLVVVSVYIMYRRSVYLEHMETARLINEKLITTGNTFKLNADKMQRRGPSLWERFTTSLSSPAHWRIYMDEVTKSIK